MVEPNYFRHNHDGINSDRLSISAFEGVPLPAITSGTSGLSSGGTGSLSSSDNAILNNALTRINELETRLKTLGLIL